MAYLGNSPLNRLFNIQAITLSQGQVNVNVAYTPGMVLFFKNGALLIPNTDYTATNGSVLTLAKAANAGDVIQGINLASYAVADAVPLSGGTVGGLLTGPASATETTAGFAQIAGQSDVDSGADDKKIVTSKKLRWGFSISLSANGHVAFPSWLGGLIIQWASISIPQASAGDFASSIWTFSKPFPNEILCAQVTGNMPPFGAAGTPDFYVGFPTKTQITCFSNYSASAARVYAFSLGH